MEIYLSELAAYKLKELTHHLLEDWSYKVKTDFLAKLDAKNQSDILIPRKLPEIYGIWRNL